MHRRCRSSTTWIKLDMVGMINTILLLVSTIEVKDRLAVAEKLSRVSCCIRERWRRGSKQEKGRHKLCAVPTRACNDSLRTPKRPGMAASRQWDTGIHHANDIYTVQTIGDDQSENEQEIESMTGPSRSPVIPQSEWLDPLNKVHVSFKDDDYHIEIEQEFQPAVEFADELYEMEKEDDSEDWKEQVFNIPVPKQTGKMKPLGTVLCTVMIAREIQQGRQCLCLLRVLVDTGSDSTLLHANCLPPGANPMLLDQPVIANMTAGTMKSKRQVWVANMILPEFDKHWHIDQCKAIVFDALCNYDIILGRDVIAKIGMDVLFSTGTIRWMDKEIPMHEPGFWHNPASTFLQLYNDLHHQEDDDPWEDWWRQYLGSDDLDVTEMFMSDMGDDGLGYKSRTIKEAKYEAVDPREAADKQTHLSQQERGAVEGV
jgi:Retroviral aspartyl protease